MFLAVQILRYHTDISCHTRTMEVNVMLFVMVIEKRMK